MLPSPCRLRAVSEYAVTVHTMSAAKVIGGRKWSFRCLEQADNNI
jgi:hypothetical protein